MKNLNKYDFIFLIGLALWLIETGFFGFHETAVSIAEKMFDQVSFLLMGYGAIMSFAGNIKTTVNINNITEK